MESVVAAEASAQVNRAWVTVVLASLGGAFEAYDFLIYGVFAREIAAHFFPATDPISGMLSTFAIFALGYIARPLGGMLLGSLGDRHGRKMVFLVSIFAMSTATIGIGLAPSYASIGVAAPLILVVFRLAQGLCFAGELPCSITYVVEEMPKRAGFVSAAVIAFAMVGILVATLASLAIRLSLTGDEIRDFGWRIPFLVGGALGFISYRFRSALEESEGFVRMKSRVARSPVREAIIGWWKQILIGIGAASIVNTSNITMFVVVPTYFTTVLKYDSAQVTLAQNIGMLTAATVIVLVGLLTDKVAARLVHRIGAGLMFLCVVPLYHLVVTRTITPIPAFAALGALGGIVNGTYAYLLADLFPTRIRFSGVALALNLSTVVFTALTPLCTTLVLQATGAKESPGIVIAVVAAVAILAGFFLRDASGHAREDSNGPARLEPA